MSHIGGYQKRDNKSLGEKVAIRRWLLSRMGIDEAYVLDTCVGLGKVWGAMEDHVAIRQWTRCDIKPRRSGVLCITANEAVARLPLDTYNVIDIDPYGEPWEPYLIALGRVTRPTAFFLTYGHVGHSNVSAANLKAVGIPDGWPVPRNPTLANYVADRILSRTWLHGDVLHSARVSLQNVTYYAIGFQPSLG